MKHLIDKSSVVAEIKRQLSAIDNYPKLTDTQIAVLEGNKIVLTKLLSFIDAFEMKDVNLDNEITDYISKHYHIRYDETLENGSDPLTVFDVEDIAIYFFELGRSSK